MALKQDELNELIGYRSGKLVVIEYLGFYNTETCSKKKHWYKCQCDCGNMIEVDRNHLKTTSSRATVSCGCSRIIHGYRNHPVYNSYRCMMGRVHHPDPIRHKHYILDNIKICEEWDGHPEVFCEWALENGYKEGLTLDRIDNKGDYTPDNCRWATPLEQANNRGNYNHNITFNGKTQSITAWSRELNIPVSTIYSRLTEGGLSVEEAFTKSVDKRFSRKD